MSRAILIVLFMIGPALAGPLDKHGLPGLLILVNEARRLDLERRARSGASVDEIRSREQLWEGFYRETKEYYQFYGYENTANIISVRHIFSPNGPLDDFAISALPEYYERTLRYFRENPGALFLPAAP